MTDHFRQTFSVSDASSANPRLRLRQLARAATNESMRRGVVTFTEGCYSAIRNVYSHHSHSRRLHCFEQITAFSLIARWVDICSHDTGT